MKKIKCNICGHRFHVKKDDVYVVSEKLSVAELVNKAAKTFDAIDCPQCGCQKPLAIRMHKVDEDE